MIARPFRSHMPLAFALILAALGSSRAAKADLLLSFGQPVYTVGVGDTTTVDVFVSQVAGGPQVGPGNELLSGDIALTFPTAGSAQVLSTADVTFGPQWDLGLTTTSTSGPDTTFNVSLLSLFGIADLSTPLLLASFQFTGIFAGDTTTMVVQFDPGSPDFITARGDVVDPTNTATARIRAVPEPGSLALLAVAIALVGPARRLRRSIATDRG